MKEKYESPKIDLKIVFLETGFAVSSEHNVNYYIESQKDGKVNNLNFFDYDEKKVGENDIYL